MERKLIGSPTAVKIVACFGKCGETRRRGVEASWDGQLPLTRSEECLFDGFEKSPLAPVYERSTPEVKPGSLKRPPTIAASIKTRRIVVHGHKRAATSQRFTYVTTLSISACVGGLATIHICCGRSFRSNIAENRFLPGLVSRVVSIRRINLDVDASVLRIYISLLRSLSIRSTIHGMIYRRDVWGGVIGDSWLQGFVYFLLLLL
jgi:hypothetical protein